MEVLFVIILWLVCGLEKCLFAPYDERYYHGEPKNRRNYPHCYLIQPFFHTLTKPTNL